VKQATPARRSRLSAEQRRESILEAAVEIFATNGYRAAKVSDVAAKVGVTEPVIFQNFGSKAALYAAVLDRVALDTRANLETLVDGHGPASELLAHVLSPGRGARPQRTPLHAQLFMDAVGLAAEPAHKDAANRALRAVADHLADLVRRGQSDGDVDADVDADAAAWLLLSVLAGRPARAAVMPNRDRLEQGVSELALRALGLEVPEPRPHPHQRSRHHG
jgi:AcrR family transcriptional regulator